MRLLHLLTIASLGPMACDGDKGAPAEDSADPGDTAIDTGDDTAPPDSGHPDTAQPTALAGTIAIPEGAGGPAELAVALVSIRFGYGPELRSTLDAVFLTESLAFTLDLPPEAPAADQYRLADEDYPDMLGALYLLVAFEDSSGDGAYQEGELIRGAPLAPLLAWLGEGGDPAWPRGWSLVDTGLSGPYETGACLLETTQPLLWRSYAGYPVFSPVGGGVDVELRGLETTLTLAGVDATGAGRLAVLPYQAVYEDESIPPLWDGPSDGDFSLTLADPPDPALGISADPDWQYALGLGVPYADDDSSGSYTAGEAADATFCLDGEEAWARYTWPVSTYRGWRLLECYGGTAGWRLVTQSGEGTWTEYRSAAEAASLVLDPDECDL